MSAATNSSVFCPLLNKEISEGYCWELCNIATDTVLLDGDIIFDWEKAQEICSKCGRYGDSYSDDE